jgi:methylmalonyl-CoA/ethylmalonyl-CoA epimerase
MAPNGPSCSFTPHHAGIIVNDLEAAMDGYIANLGYSFFHFEVNAGNASLSVGSASFTLRLAIGQLGLNLVELIQPVSGDTLYSRRLDEEGPGLHHLAFAVDELTKARSQLEASGYICLQNGSIQGLVECSYYDAKELGCVVEPLQLSCDLTGFLLKNAKPYSGRKT